MATIEPNEPTQLFIYSKPGCHLCEESDRIVRSILLERAARGLRTAQIVERNIQVDEDWYRAFFDTIPVLQIDDRQLPLAIHADAIRAFIDVSLGTRPVSVR